MKNRLFILLFPFMMGSAISNAQTGIGTTRPDASALLDLTSTTKGFLLPRLTLLQQQALVNPAIGLLIFNTTRLFAIVILTLISYAYPMLLFFIIGLCGSYFYFR